MRMHEGKVIKGRTAAAPPESAESAEADEADEAVESAAVSEAGPAKEKTMKVRLFIGLELPAKVKVRVHKAARPVLGQVQKGRFTEADNYHLTVFFIGEVPQEEVPVWTASVMQAAAVSSPFELTLCHTGFFTRKNKKILWFGSEASGQLDALYNNVMAAVDQALFSQGKPFASTQPGANRPFIPHITLGRDIVAEEASVVIRTEKIKVRLETLTLFESKRISGHLAYVPIARGRLQERL